MGEAAKGIVLAQGIPDNGLAPAIIDQSGTPAIQMPNQMRLLPETLDSFDRQHQIHWFPSQPFVPASGLRGVVNLCIEPWGHRKALNALQNWTKQSVPVFNHPAAVFRLQKSDFLTSLSKINGLEVPRWVGLVARQPDDFHKAVSKAGLRYPVKLQQITDHSNGADLLIKSDRDWPKISTLDWPGKSFVISEIRPEHLAKHQRWRISFAGRSAEFVSFDYANRTFETGPATDHEGAELPAGLHKICGTMLGGVGLDHWTAEFSRTEGDRFRLEHIWAGLPEWLDDNLDDVGFRLFSKIAPRLHDLVLSPGHWHMTRVLKAQSRGPS